MGSAASRHRATYKLRPLQLQSHVLDFLVPTEDQLFRRPHSQLHRNPIVFACAVTQIAVASAKWESLPPPAACNAHRARARQHSPGYALIVALDMRAVSGSPAAAASTVACSSSTALVPDGTSGVDGASAVVLTTLVAAGAVVAVAAVVVVLPVTGVVSATPFTCATATLSLSCEGAALDGAAT